MTDPFASRDLLEIARGTRIFSGALLHADLAGFTGLAERLGSHGRQGTEQLTGVLNSALDAILRPIRDAGGVALYFAGDSVTARLPDSSGASDCAELIHRNLKALGTTRTLEGEVAPRATVNIGVGRWGETVLASGHTSHLLLSGPLVSRLADLERQSAGPTGTSRVRLFVPPVISGPTCAVASDGGQRTPDASFSAAEHRTMAALFVRLFGYDAAKPPIQQLQSAYATLSGVAERFGGSLHLVDSVVRDGCRVFLLFGAPRATGRDARNAVLAARKIIDELGGIPDMDAAIGLGYGFAYSGVVGNDWRRQYTVIGDSVNTAARLADTASSGSVVVSEDVRRAAVGELAFEELPPVMAKGKAGAVRRFAPSRTAGRDFRRYGFVGRKRELTRLAEALSSPEVLVDLTGEAGIGKTRLLAELAASFEEAGRNVVCFRPEEPRGIDDHLASLLFGLCGIDADSGAEERRSRLARALHCAGGKRLANLQSIPGSILLGLEYPDSPYSDLTPQLRRENLMDCLQALMLDAGDGTVLILDDAHLLTDPEMKELSELVCSVLSASDGRISALFSRRPTGPSPSAASGITVRGMELSDLDHRARRQLMRAPLDGAGLDPEVEAAVMERAQGNPFYLLQMLLYMVEKDLLVREGGTWVPSSTYSADSLPDNVFSMIMARIDRLEKLARECLRIASVIGMEFSTGVVSSLLRGDAGSSLDEAATAGLIYAASIRQLEYVFSHMLIRDVAYGSMMRKRRRELHGRVASLLEDLDAPAAVLAYHFELAEEWEKALMNSMAAGKRAVEEYRNTKAMEHFEKAAELAGILGDRQEETAAAWKSYASVLDIVGDYDQAMEYYERVTGLVPPGETWAVSMHAIAQIHFIRGDFQTALEVVAATETALEEASAMTSGFRVRFPCFKAWVCGVRGEVEEAMEHARNGLEAALGMTDTHPRRLHSLGYAYNTLATVYWARGEMDVCAEYYGKALALAREMGARREIAVTLGNLGLVYEKQGKFEQAIDVIRQKLATGREIGEKYMVCSSHGELVPCLLRAGRIREARRNCDEYIRISREMVSTHDVLIGLGLRVLLLMSCGRFDEADPNLEELERTAREKGYQREVSTALTYRGWLSLLRGRPEEAIPLLRESYEKGEAGNSSPQAKALHARAVAEAGGDSREIVRAAEAEAGESGALNLADTLLHTGAAMSALRCSAEARTRLERALRIYSGFSSPLHMAETRLELGRLHGISEKESSEHLTAAAELFDSIGLPGRAADCRNL
jgi:class 3 adenylate cyclase/tetratricopeptide (TPR) repeat protein